MHLANILFSCRKGSIHLWQSLKRTVLPLSQNLLYIIAAIFSYSVNGLGDVHMSRLMDICFFVNSFFLHIVFSSENWLRSQSSKIYGCILFAHS